MDTRKLLLCFSIGIWFSISIAGATVVITVSSPASASAVPACGNIPVYWTVTGSGSQYYDAELHGVTGTTDVVVKSFSHNSYSISANNHFTLPMPATTLSYSHYYLKIIDFYIPANNGKSGNFTIAVPQPTVALSLTGAVYLEVNWPAITNATDYILNMTNVTTGLPVTAYTNYHVSGINIYNLYLTGLSPANTYSVTVQSVTPCGTSSSSTPLVATTCVLPGAPTAVSATSITSTGFTANWSAPPGGADQYVVTIGATSYAPTSMLSQPITGLGSYTTYSYTVTAYKCGSASTASNAISVKTPMAAPVLGGGTTLIGCDGFSLDLGWSTVSGAVSYAVYFDGGIVQICSCTSTIGGAFGFGDAPSFQVAGIAADGTSGPLSDPITLTVNEPPCCAQPNSPGCGGSGRVSALKPADVAPTSIGGYALEAYPNPAREQLHVYRSQREKQNNPDENDSAVAIHAFVKSPIAVKLFNLRGEQVLTGSDESGEVVVDVKGVPSGVYILSSEVSGQMLRKTILIGK